MMLKQRVNSGLARLTGYRIVRAPRDGANGAARKRGAAPKRRRKALPKDYDDDAKQIIRAVRPYTMTDADKLFALIEATRYVSRHRIPGAIVECGVWRGGSMQAAARALIEAGDSERELYLFDTFEGMPAPSERDVRHDGRSAEELLAARAPETSKVWAVATLEDVQEAFAQVPYPPERVHFVKGRVEDTVPARAAAP